ncbi:MAG: hypothetical protein NT118_02225 [Lentisphaerae bacterium]|nr:hypothetical protein [Lentisphaerota bacterium]
MAKLTTDDLTSIAMDVLSGKKPSIKSPEADKFCKELEKNIDLAKTKGWVVDIPHEWNIDIELKSKIISELKNISEKIK